MHEDAASGATGAQRLHAEPSAVKTIFPGSEVTLLAKSRRLRLSANCSLRDQSWRVLTERLARVRLRGRCGGQLFSLSHTRWSRCTLMPSSRSVSLVPLGCSLNDPVHGAPGDFENIGDLGCGVLSSLI